MTQESADAVRARIQNDPLNMMPWIGLLEAEQASPQAAMTSESLSVVIAGLSALRNVPEAYGKLNSNPSAREAFSRLAWDCLNPGLVKAIGLLYLREVGLASLAKTHFELASTLGSEDPQIASLIEEAAVAASDDPKAPMPQGLGLTPDGTLQLPRMEGDTSPPGGFDPLSVAPGPVTPSELSPPAPPPEHGGFAFPAPPDPDDLPPGQPFIPSTPFVDPDAPTIPLGAIGAPGTPRAPMTPQGLASTGAGSVEPSPSQVAEMTTQPVPTPQRTGDGGGPADSDSSDGLSHTGMNRPDKQEPPITQIFSETGKLTFGGANKRAVAQGPSTTKPPTSVLAQQGGILAQIDQKVSEGEMGEAVRLCGQAASQLDPESMANTWALVGEACFQRADMLNAILCYREACTLQPELFESWFNLGTAQHYSGEFEDALDSYQRAAEIDPSHPKLCCNLGAVSFQLDHNEDAILCLQQAVHSDPNYARAWHNLGTVLGAVGRLDEAVDAFQRVVALRGDRPETSFRLGMIFYSQDRLDEARLHFESASAHESTRGASLHYLCMIHARQSNLDIALAIFSQARTSGSKTRLAWLAANEIGRAFTEQEQHAQAVEYFEEAVELGGGEVIPLINLGEAKFFLGQYDQARTAFERALSINRKTATAWHGLGVIASQQGDIPQSITAFQEAVEIEPHNARGWYDLGVALHKGHRQQESEEALRRALHIASEMDQIPPEFAPAVERLRQMFG